MDKPELKKTEQVEKKKVELKIDLQSFLDTMVLTRAERMYYQRTYGRKYEIKTSKEWRKIIKIVHK